MERSESEERKRQRERQLMEEGRCLVLLLKDTHNQIAFSGPFGRERSKKRSKCYFEMLKKSRNLLEQKCLESMTVSEVNKSILLEISRPGHGAPTQDIRKKKFTEHQINKGIARSQSTFSLDDSNDFISTPKATMGRFSSETDLQEGVGVIFLLYQF